MLVLWRYLEWEWEWECGVEVEVEVKMWGVSLGTLTVVGKGMVLLIRV